MTSQPGIDPRGAIRGSGIPPIVSAGRVEYPRLAFEPAAIPQYPGHGSWIWLNHAAEDSGTWTAVFLRRGIELNEAPESARIWFSADAHARIYVNGTLVARGPDDSGQDYPGQQTGRQAVNFIDLTPHFKSGTNVIAAEVFSADAMLGRYNTTGRGGFLFEAELDFSGGDSLRIVSDASWKGIPAPCWHFADWKERDENHSVRCLHYDARQEPHGWRLVGFKDDAWPTCEISQVERPSLFLSEIPPRAEATYPRHSIECMSGVCGTDGQSITLGADGACQVQFDRVISGFIGFNVRATAGDVLAIQPNELKQHGYHRMAVAVLVEGVQSFELPFYDSFSAINLQSSHVAEQLEILDVRANFVAQPVAYRGSFKCNDAGLNHIWNVSRWLTQICQQTHHLDSPHHQEPISDPGDYVIESLNNYYAFHQPHLARQDLRKYAWLLDATQFRPFHTSYALLWLQMLLDYWDHTDDASLVHELAPTVHAMLDQFASYVGPDGILSNAPDYMFMDWVKIAGYDCHHPPAVIGQGYMTAFYYRALADGIRVADVGGDSVRAIRYEDMRTELREAYNRELWDEAAGLYLDGLPFRNMNRGDWLPDDIDLKTHSAQNNALAVLYDLAPPEQHPAIMRRLLAHDLNCQPYFMHFVFGALAHAGLFNEHAAMLMRRWQVVEDTQSFCEMWDAGDYSHAWQCTPLYQLSARVLGVTPLSPGFAEIGIAPHSCDLEWAKGSIPTPHGDVVVSWTRNEDMFEMTVVVPKGCTAKFTSAQLGETSKVALDGQAVEGRAVAGLDVPAGTHELRMLLRST